MNQLFTNQDIQNLFNNEGIDKQTISESIDTLLAKAGTCTNLSFGLTLNKQPNQGILALTGILDCARNDKDPISMIEESFSKVRKDVQAHEELSPFLDCVSIIRDAETVDNIPVTHVQVMLKDIPAITQDSMAMEAENVKVLLGEPDFRIRLGVVNNNRLVMTMGGGTDRFATIARLAGANKAPLTENPLFKANDSAFPKNTTVEFYASTTGLLQALTDFMNAVGQTIHTNQGGVTPPPITFKAGSQFPGLQEYTLVIPYDQYPRSLKSASAFRNWDEQYSKRN